jgi:glycosyltransferase involved in cell wall biosynthesis
LAQELTRLSYEVTLCSLWDYNTPFERQHRHTLQAAGVDTFTGAPWTGRHLTRGFMAASRTIRARHRSQTFQAVHSHSEFADIAALLVGLANPRLPLLRTVHYGFGQEWRRRPLRRYIFTNFLIPLRFAREIGVSPGIVRTLDQRPLANLIGRPGVYINNAVNLSRFSGQPPAAARLRESLAIPEQAFVIGSVGRLTEQKAYDVLIEAAFLALQDHPQLFFLIIGEGEERAQLEQRIARLGIAARVRLIGSRPDVEQLLELMDLFVSSSRWEGLPTVIMESLASGVPVVATDIPGSRDLIQPHHSGWLAQPDNPQDLALKIQEAVKSDNQRAAYALAGQDVVQDFSIQKVARKYAELYQALSGQ